MTFFVDTLGLGNGDKPSKDVVIVFIWGEGKFCRRNPSEWMRIGYVVWQQIMTWFPNPDSMCMAP